MLDEESCKNWLIEMFLIETRYRREDRTATMVRTEHFDIVGSTFRGEIIPWDQDQFFDSVE